LEKLNREEGVTVFLTTQNMEEADRLCRRVSIIDNGKIIAEGSPLELKEAIGGDTITLSFKDDAGSVLRSKTKAILGAVEGVTNLIDSYTHSPAFERVRVAVWQIEEVLNLILTK
jgi:ABC-type multidrug transport system ATPase subunit